MRKKCSACKKLLLVKEFGKHPEGEYGRQSCCRKCYARKRKRQYRALSLKDKKEFIQRVTAAGRRYRLKKLQQGICIYCRRKVLPGFSQCQVCRNKHRNRQALRIARAKKTGLCTTCGCRPIVPGHSACDSCIQRHKDYFLALRLEVQTAYGGKCNCCGETGPLFLTMDHVLNNGAAHRREMYPKAKSRLGSGYGFYLWLKKRGFPQDEFQLLCMTCNWGKRMNKGICPHKSDPVGHPLPLRNAA